MGVLSKWFKKADSRNPAADGSAGSAVEVEPKPSARPYAADSGDQAARLRQAVSAAEREAAAQRSTPDFDTAPSADDSGFPIEEDAESVAIDAEDEPQPLARRSKSPRSKQELIEELHRNYQEVLGLIRKLDGHLDETRGRSESIAQVADQYGKLAPIIESLPGELSDRAGQLSAELRTTIEQEGTASRQLLERIESAIVNVGVDIERSTDQQGQLVQTMAEFRESLTELSRSSTVACESVRDSESRAAERDRALLDQLRQTRLWLIGLTVGGGVIGLAALILGVLALRG